MYVCVCVYSVGVCVCVYAQNVMWVWFELFRDLRLRQHLGTRYDTRRGVFDWDYHMKLTEMVWREGRGGRVCPMRGGGGSVPMGEGSMGKGREGYIHGGKGREGCTL